MAEEEGKENEDPQRNGSGGYSIDMERRAWLPWRHRDGDETSRRVTLAVMTLRGLGM